MDFLSSQQIQDYHRDGYLHIPNALPLTTCNTLRERASTFVDSYDPNQKASIFTTNDQERVSDDYFLSSADKISCFMEEKAAAFDKTEQKWVLNRPIAQAVNKIGHNLHEKDDLFHAVSYSPHVISILHTLKYHTPLAVQSMYIFKQPSIGGEVRPHQDGTFLYTQPASVLGLWWALQDCTLENGCLWGIPGSHLTTPIEQVMVRKADGNGTEMVPKVVAPYVLTEAVPILAKTGDLVLIHHAFVHFSKENNSTTSRHAYTMHVIEGHETEYPKENWLQRPEGNPFNAIYTSESS